MNGPTDRKALQRSFKRLVLPLATRVFASRGLRRLPPLLEMTGAALQSKRGGGCAATWQEIEGALNFITAPAPVIFDVGANVGTWTAALLKALPEAREVVMFEPQPSCWAKLEEILSDRVSLVKKAASDAPGTLAFWASPNFEMSSLYEKPGGGDGSRQILVEAITLDDFIARNQIEAVDYVKIDVEGHELAVIKGARRSIQQGKVKAFSFEFGEPDIASRTFFIDLWEYLTGLGLRVYRLGHDGFAIHIPRYFPSLENFSGAANYVASINPPKRCRLND